MASASSASASSEDVRLPAWQRPSRYNVALVPDLRAFTFQGHVLVTMALTQPSQSIVLHAADLTFPSADDGKLRVSVRALGDAAASAAPIHCQSLSLDAKAERVSFDFGSALPAGEWELSVHYNGVLNDQLAGFYRSSYKGANGETKHMAVTQFEATDARRALPCVDEPAAKAVFDVTLIVDPALTAVSNMPILEKTTTSASESEPLELSRGLRYAAGMARHTYYSSPIMSTYLLAFIVGEFDFISATSARGTEVKVYTGLGKTHLGRFSLKTAVAALDFYNDYFGIHCAITYRETALLIDPENSSAAMMQRVARTVCHEIAHMWFGNLVTMEWWSYLWLNEGFARFMEHKAVDAIYPKWKIWESFVADVFAQAQSLDALESSHPVEVTVNHPSEVNEIFDTISYAKGASLIRMLNAAIGDEAFRTGLQSYLNKFSFQNTQTSDLWDALSESSGTNVGAMMNEWVVKIGFPMLHVSPGSVPQKLCFCQERFLASYDRAQAAQLAESGTVWTIPVAVASWKKVELQAAAAIKEAGGADALPEPHVMKVLFDVRKGEYPVLGYEPESVLKVNVNQTGFYRVSYEESILASIAPSIPLLPAVERLGLLRDCFALGSSGRTGMRPSLELLQFYAREENYAVVSALAGNLSLLASLHHDQPYHAQIQSLVRHLFAYNFQRLGWEPAAGAKEDQLQVLFRALVINMLGNVGGDAAVQQEALRRFRAFVQAPVSAGAAAPVSIPADLRACIYAMVAKKGTDEDRAALLGMYRASELQEEKNRLLAVLGVVEGRADASAEVAAAEVARIRWALSFLLSDEVRPGNVAFLMSGIGSSARGRKEAWSWFQEKFPTVQERFCKGQNFIISGLLNGMLGGGTDRTAVQEFQAFFEKNPIPQAKRALQQLSEAITLRAARLARESAEVQAWLAANANAAQ